MKNLLIIALLLLANLVQAQDDETEYTYETFRDVRLINGQSVETIMNGGLNFEVNHRFGSINQKFAGLDFGNIRLGFGYGITDRFTVGFGRSKFFKAWDFYGKAKILRQSTGKKTMPFSLTWHGNSVIRTLEGDNFYSATTGNNYHYAFTNQLLLARKFADKVSLQLMPTLVYLNLENADNQSNTHFSLGVAARYKFNWRWSLLGEYYYNFSSPTITALDTQNQEWALAIELNTGLHAFQITVGSSQYFNEDAFAVNNFSRFTNSDSPIHIGFNIVRTFMLK